MSGSLGDLTVRFTGDASQLAATISEVQGSLSGLEGASGKAVKGLQGLDSVSGKNLEQIAQQTRAQGGLKTILDKTSKSLEEKKTKLAEVEKAYNENKPKIEANIRSLKDERSSIDDSIKASRDKIATLREQNAALKSNSKEYRSNIATIQNTTQGIYDQQQKRNDLTAQIQRQQSALKKEEAAYRSAESAVKTASAQFQTLAGSQKEIVRMERALALEETGESLQKFGDSVNTITKPLQVVATGLAAGGVAAAKFAIDFEDNFANVEKTVDGTPEQLEEVRQGIIDLTTTGIDGRNAIPQTTAQLTELAAAGGQLGIETENILEFTETMAQMGTATNLAGEEGAKTLARFMNVTGTSQDKVKNLGSAIVDLGNNFATSESEIASMAMRIGSTGSVVGISAQDILGYSTALSSLGMEAEAGGSAVSRIWMDMQSAVASGGETLTEFAKVSGKSSEEFAAQWKKDASGAFLDFLTGLSKSEDQVKALSDLGFNNIYDIQALQRLASQEGIGLVTEALQRSNTAWEENIALQEEFDAKAETTASQIQITKNNLVEAGRSIGEAFLPIITDVSSNISDFAQGIANLDDSAKQNIITTGAWVVGIGAASKATAGIMNTVGSITQGIGTLRKGLTTFAAAASEGIGVVSNLSSALGAVAPALGTAAGWLAVPAAMYIGMEKYADHVREAYQEFLHIGDGADEIGKTAAAALAAASDVGIYAEKLREVNEIISKGSDGSEEGDAAYNAALNERKQIIQWFIDNYGDYVSAMGDGQNVTQTMADTIQKMSEAEKSVKMAELEYTIAEGEQNIGDLQETVKTLRESTVEAYNNNTALMQLKTGLIEFNSEYETLNKQFDDGKISAEDYVDSLDQLEEKYKSAAESYELLTGDNWEGLEANPDIISGALASMDKRMEENSSNIEKWKGEISTAEESINKYQEAARTMSEVMINDIPNAMKRGDGSVQEYIDKIGQYGRATQLTLNEMGKYANQTALALNGFGSAAEAAEAGDAAMNATVNDTISTMQKWGYSAEQAVVQAALLKNGFDDIASAAATDGGVEVVAQQATELAHSLGMLEGKTIKFNVETGTFDLINEVGNTINSFDGETVTATVEMDVEGYDEAINVATLVKNFGMETAVAILAAQDEASVKVDGVNYKLQSIDGKTGQAIVTAEDGATYVLNLVTGELRNLDGTVANPKVEPEISPAVQQFQQEMETVTNGAYSVEINATGDAYNLFDKYGNALGEIDGRAATVTINAEGNYEVIDEAGNKLAEIDGETGTVNITTGDTSGIEAAEEANDLNNDDVSITITANGDTAQIEEVQSAVNAINGQQCTVQVNAQGNYDVLDEAGNKVAEINGQTAEVTVSATDSATPIVIGVASSLSGLPQSTNTQINAQDNASGTISSVASQLASLNGRSATVTVNIQTNGSFPGNFAKGTKNFSGGLAMINDQPGISDPRELVQIGDRGYIFEGRDVIVPLPEHAKVYTATQTKQMMTTSGIPHYAGGKNNEEWENAKSEREHIRKVTYRIIDPREELEWLEEMKKKFASDAEVIKEIEEQVVEYTRKMWASDLENMQYALDMGWQSEEEYYKALAEYRDQNFAPDTQEYKDATLELHKYAVQLIDDANELSEAYIDLHGRLNDWGEMGTSMGAVWQTVNKRNVQAAQDGLITWQDYFETREGLTEQFLDNYIDYSDDWIKHEQDYNAMGADDTIAAINRQRAEVERYFAEIGELTDEEYALKAEILAELDDKSMDAALDKVNEWRDDADWYKRQADVYGWDFLHDDSETKYWQRVIDGEMEAYQNEALSLTARQEALRKADEARLELYQATEDEYDEMLDMAQDRIDETEKALSDRLSALDESWEVEDRAKEKAEVLTDLDKYKNAVTIEGRDKYEELQEQLKEIEREETRYAMEQENNAILEQLEAEYEALENEKAKVLQQVRDANLNVAALIEPLKENIADSMGTLGDKIAASIDRIRPSVTFTQNNTNYINDGTDGILYQNKVFNQAVDLLGG